MSYTNNARSMDAEKQQTVTGLIGDCQTMTQQAHDALNRMLGIDPPTGTSTLSPVPNGSIHNAFEMLHGLRSSLDALVSRCANVANKFD